MDAKPLKNVHFYNKTVLFFWADLEPSPMSSFSTQRMTPESDYNDSNFDDSPFVIATISAGLIGVGLMITAALGIWIRSQLERRRNELLSSTYISGSVSTLDLDMEAGQVDMEMDDRAAVLGSIHTATDNYRANDVTIEMKPNGEPSFTVNDTTVPLNLSEKLEIPSCSYTDDHVDMTLEKTEQESSSVNVSDDGPDYSVTEGIVQCIIRILLSAQMSLIWSNNDAK